MSENPEEHLEPSSPADPAPHASAASAGRTGRLEEGTSRPITLPVLLAGWAGYDVALVHISVAGDEVHERRARAVPGRHAAEDIARARPRTIPAQSAEAAPAAAETAVTALLELGYRIVDDVQTLDDLPSPPPAVREALREALVADSAGPYELVMRVGGRPRLAAHENWPTCICCAGLLVFVAELPLQDDARHVQVFMCRTGGREGSCTPRFVALLRPVEGVEKHDVPALDAPLPSEHVTRWRSVRELPSGNDTRRAGLRYKRFAPRPIVASHHRTTKLGGWPSWQDFGATPRCATCLQSVVFVGQLRGIPSQLLWGAEVGLIRVFACLACDSGCVVHAP